MKKAFKSILMILLVLSLISSCKKKTIEPEPIKTTINRPDSGIKIYPK